jgi:hypothetical protein
MQLRSLAFLLLFVCFNCFCVAQNNPPIDTSKAGDLIFEKIDIEAGYPGGITAWRKYLERNLNAIVPVDNGAPAGYYTVHVRFIVSRTGEVTDVKALTNIGYGMEQEVIRIIKKSGKWTPGIQNDRAVNSYHTQPVTFVELNDWLTIKTKVPNKLFAGVDNEISISADKVKQEDMNVTITNGKITLLNNGNYSVKVNDTTRRAVITVYHAKKKDKEIGAESFEVRPARETPDAKKD